MKLKGKTLKAAPVDLGMLQTWLGKLLDLPCPPSTEECMEGKILVAALHKVSSRHPMAPSSSVELLLGRREPEAGACGTFERLEAEMLDAGLKQQTPLLGQVAAGDVPALEKLLLAIYQFYALNHAHKFDRTKQPNNATPFGNAAPSPVSLDEAPTSPQMPLAAHGAAQDHRRPPQQRVSAASDQLPLAGGGARAQVARESLRRREDPEQAGDGQALCGFQGEDIVQNFAEQPETVCGSRCLAPLSLGSPPSGEPVSEAEPAWAEGGGVIEDPNDRTPSVRDSSGSEQGRMLVASLTATTPRHSAHRKPIRAAEAPKGAAEGKWMEPSLRCLAAWLGGVIGRHDPVGRLLLGNSPASVKATMLDNAAAHRSAVEQLLGLPHTGRHATATAASNVSATLDALEACGMAVDAKLRSACEVLPPTDARGSLSGSAQLSLGAAVAEAAVGISQRGEFSAMGGLKLLRWADGLAELGSEQFRRPFISSINGKDQVAWELINWQTVAVISASALGARGSSWEEDPPADEAVWYQRADSFCSSAGIPLPFGPEDLPDGLVACGCMRAVLVATLADLRRQKDSRSTSPKEGGEIGASAAVKVDTTTSAAPLSSSKGSQRSRRVRQSLAEIPDDHGLNGQPSEVEVGHPDERPDLLDGPAEPLAFHVDGPMLDRRMGSTQAAVASTSATSASLNPVKKEPAVSLDQEAISGSPAQFLEERERMSSRASTAPMDFPRPKSSRGSTGTSSQRLQPVGILPAEDTPHRLPSANGYEAEVLMVEDGSRARSVDKSSAHVRPLSARLAVKSGAGPGVAAGGRLGSGHGQREERSCGSHDWASRESLVPSDMFAPPPLKSQVEPTAGACDVHGQGSLVADLAQLDNSTISSYCKRPQSAGKGHPGFLQEDVFAPPSRQNGESLEVDPPGSPDQAERTSTEHLLEKVACTSGIGRFRSKRNLPPEAAVGASVAVEPMNRARCPELSASTPHLHLGGARAERATGTSVQGLSGTHHADGLAESFGSLGLVSIGEEARGGGHLLSPSVDDSIDGSETYRCRNDQTEVASPSVLVEEHSLEAIWEDLDGNLNPNPPVAAASDMESEQQDEILVGGPRSAVSSMQLLARHLVDSRAGLPVAPEAMPTGQPGPPWPHLEEEASTLELTLWSGVASPVAQVHDVSMEGMELSLRDSVRPADDGPLPVAVVAVQQSPGILSGGQTLHPAGRGFQVPPAQRQLKGGSPGLVSVGHWPGRGPRLPSDGTESGEEPRVAPLPPVAFDIADGPKELPEGVGDNKAEERRAKVQAMLDAKRERFLLERKAREEEAAEKLAREERQRKTLAKQREAEAAARKAAKKISNTAPETGPEAGLQDTAAPPPELSSSGRQRTRQEILAVTDLPLEDHLALIVSGGANGEQEAAGAVVPGPTLSGADVAGTTEPLRSARMDKAEVAASSKPPAGRAPPPPMFSRTSNRKLIRNALSHVCLAGAARAKEKDLVLSALDAYKGDDSFIVLFKNSTMPLHFRGLYVQRRHDNRVLRLYGKGPEEMVASQITTYFKYDSGARDFKAIQTSDFTFGITAGVARS